MPYGYIDPGQVAIFIPILMVIGGVFIAITAIIVGGRKKDLEHRERLIAMEKGIPIPDPPPARREREPSYRGRRASGFVLTGIGLAVTMGLWAEDGFASGVWGLIPLFIGVALLIAASLDKRDYMRMLELRQFDERHRAAAPPPSPIVPQQPPPSPQTTPPPDHEPPTA